MECHPLTPRTRSLTGRPDLPRQASCSRVGWLGEKSSGTGHRFGEHGQPLPGLSCRLPGMDSFLETNPIFQELHTRWQNNKMTATSVRTVPDSADLSDVLGACTDPVDRLLLTGQARTVREAEEMYLDAAYPQVLALLASPLSNEELGHHPLLLLYRFHGSRPREDSLL